MHSVDFMPGGKHVIQLRHQQPGLWESLFAKEVAELWEPCMGVVDELLEDEALVDAVYEAQGERHERSRTLPSLAEGLPGALIEAMAAGLPCIATDIPGNRELVRDGKTGSLVPVGSPEALEHAIRIMLTDRPFAEHCAQAAYDLVAREYDEEVEKREWQRLFSHL